MGQQPTSPKEANALLKQRNPPSVLAGSLPVPLADRGRSHFLRRSSKAISFFDAEPSLKEAL
ncbi:hypothetical protein GGD66_007922 [Bradyrhizobium sp. CIR48]|nr:hypothetical protein [Bradyrhizobium sp. CIR48]